MGIREGEALLAVTGIGAALAPGPLRLNQEILGRALGLPRAIRRRLRRFVAGGPRFGPVGKMAFFDYEQVLERLPMVTQARLEENVAMFRGDQALADDYMTALGQAVGYLQSIFPRRTRETMVSSDNVRPADLSLSAFRRAYWVADDPLVCLDDLNVGILVSDQVTALKKLFPGIYDEITTAVFEVVVARKSDRPRWELPYVREGKLKTLLQATGDDSKMRAAIKEAFERARGGEAPGQQAAAPMKPTEPTRQQTLAEK